MGDGKGDGARRSESESEGALRKGLGIEGVVEVGREGFEGD